MDEDNRSAVWRFLFPKFTWKYLLRICITALAAAIVFGLFARPFYINGGSMLPTYPASGLVLCDMFTYRFVRPPARGEIVVLEFDGKKTMLLKRLLAFPGETVEYRKGKMYINGKLHPEPYVQYPCNWNMKPVSVPEGEVFVMGDNRSMPISEHKGGLISSYRIKGRPWFKSNEEKMHK